MRDSRSGDPTALSRRLLWGGVAAAPVVAKVGTVSPASVAAPAVSTAARCAEIVAYRDEVNYMHHRYGDLESVLWDQGWNDLSEEEQRALPLGPEFIEIDQRLDVAAETLEGFYEEAVGLVSRDVNDVIGKVLVVSRYLFPDDDPAPHAILITAADELQHLHCPGCGAPLATRPGR